MENFDKRMALEAIEDALTDLDTAHGRGVATGLCGAFYMCGLISVEEWEAFLRRIPAESSQADGGGISEAMNPVTRKPGQYLN